MQSFAGGPPVRRQLSGLPARNRTIPVYNGAMAGTNKAVRRTVTLPAETVRSVRGLAKRRRLSENRVIVELVQEGMKAQRRKRERLAGLTERSR